MALLTRVVGGPTFAAVSRRMSCRRSGGDRLRNRDSHVFGLLAGPSILYPNCEHITLKIAGTQPIGEPSKSVSREAATAAFSIELLHLERGTRVKA